MYKVIIVDDELLVINSLKNRIDWKEQGFEIIGEARNGLAAYDKIMELKPDIVFTDIRMAGMSGLELIKKVNDQSMNILFVVISGYAEFAYAQKALNYGALGFCLKPFEEDEIIAILKTARKKIEKIKEDQEIELLSYLENLSEDGSRSGAKLMEKMGFSTDRNFNFISVVSNGPTPLEIPAAFVNIALRIGRNKYIYIIETEAEEFIASLKGPKSGQAAYSINLPADLESLGISSSHSSFDALKTAFDQANIASYQWFVKSAKSVVYKYIEINPDTFDTMIKELMNLLVQKDSEGIEKYTGKLADLFRGDKFTIQQALKIYNIFIYLSDRDRNDRDRNKNRNDSKHENSLESYDELIGLFTDAQTMLSCLTALALKNEMPPPKIAVTEQENVNDTYMRIIKYINDNYSSDISVQSIASKLQSNPNYISYLFKKESGGTFREYLTGVRVKHACEMLKTGELPVYEVAERSGYKDYFHFAKIFKKVTGKTPTEYRDGN